MCFYLEHNVPKITYNKIKYLPNILSYECLYYLFISCFYKLSINIFVFFVNSTINKMYEVSY